MVQKTCNLVCVKTTTHYLLRGPCEETGSVLGASAPRVSALSTTLSLRVKVVLISRQRRYNTLPVLMLYYKHTSVISTNAFAIGLYAMKSAGPRKD